MKKTALFSICTILLYITAIAQVETTNSVKVPKKFPKGIEKAPKTDIYIGNFSVTYKMQKQQNAQTQEAKLFLRHRVEIDLTEKEALAITDKGYQYFKSELEKIGFNVKTYDMEAIKASRTFSKASKKDEAANTSSGATFFAKPKDINQWAIGTYATGVNTCYLGSSAGGLNYAGLNCELGGKEGKLVINFDASIDFIDWEESSKESAGNKTVTLSSSKDLQLNGNGYSSTFSHYTITKPEIHIFGGGEYHNKDVSWVAEEIKNNEDVTIWKLNKENYSNASFELIKAYVDEIVNVIKASKSE